MLRTRLIPVLLLRNGRLVKPKRFGENGERDVGSPVTTARIYNSQDADELIFLDISATNEGRNFLLETLREVAKNCFIPLTAGGGIKTIEDVQELLQNGADKVSINTSAVENPSLIAEIADKFGRQCVVVSIDVKENQGGVYEVFTHSGKNNTGLNALLWAKEAYKNGAGEILITSIDKEGTMTGYDIKLLKSVSGSVPIPIIANGGAGTRQDFVDAIKTGGVSAVAASSVFHFSDSNLTQVKSFLINGGVPMRPIN